MPASMLPPGPDVSKLTPASPSRGVSRAAGAPLPATRYLVPASRAIFSLSRWMAACTRGSAVSTGPSIARTPGT